MKNRGRRNGSSGDMFSFPVIQDPDQFEFGCVITPGSPNSPADHLFFNGKLLPHAFLIQTSSTFSSSRSMSRTSSISSKDSLMSSRSNSTNSKSSNCSSARTSTSEAASEKKLSSSGDFSGRISVRKQRKRPAFMKCSQYRLPESSQRWQLFPAAPVLKHQGSRSRKVEILERKESKKSQRRIEHEDYDGKKSWFGWKILRSFVSACKECHAIKT